MNTGQHLTIANIDSVFAQ